MSIPPRTRLVQLIRPAGVNVLLGIWLSVSTFVLPETFDEAMVTCILGVLIALSSAATFFVTRFHYLDTLLALLLFIAATVLPSASGVTRINDLCVAAAVFALSLPPGGAGAPLVRRRAHR